jgi:hypothetical protein
MRSISTAIAAILLAAAGASAEKVLTIGDSITRGRDDERYPEDSCNGLPVTLSSARMGLRGVLECELGAAYEWSSYAAGGQTSAWGAVRIDQAIATMPDGDTAIFSLHTNDCAADCGRVCSDDQAACIDDTDCSGAGAFCDTTNQHACTSAESKANVKTAIDALLAAGYTRVIFWKSPGRVAGLEVGSQCALAQFDGTADAIDTLFLTDLQPTGYADDSRVEYIEETFTDFCVGSNLQGCGPDDGLGDRRTWWFAKDAASRARGEGSIHVHPNAWGYMELAARIGEQLVGLPLNTRPPVPVVSLYDRTSTSITVQVPPLVDADGDSLDVYVWASCTDTSGGSADPACDLTPRECGAISGADHDGPGVGEQSNPQYPERNLVIVDQGFATLTDLEPGVNYRICATAYDGFQGSFFDDSIVTSPVASVPAWSLAAYFAALTLLALAARRSLR